jgi:hypothetical protein
MAGRKTIVVLFSVLGLLFLLFLGYAGWNNASPERSCASCHEIVPSLEIWQKSAHREVGCADCHGTALGNGFHSLKEKAGMVFTHLGSEEGDIQTGLNEDAVLRVMEACVNCHRDEYKSWMAGGHSATYSDIFLNEKHNSMERLYPDCFRCHGMYYDKTVADLVEPISRQGPWELKEADKIDDPVIPCLACHPIHMENEMQAHPASLDDPSAIFYERKDRNPLNGLYLRSERMHLRVDVLPKPAMFLDETMLLVSDDPVQRLCMQCHAPNWTHEAGTEDDRTPTGVHEGLSCRACHRGHSNNARDACLTCHPAVSSCGLDVKTMNTSYFDRTSPNDIHSMTCLDCHDPIPEI